MLTPTTNSLAEHSDIISYARWFSLNGVTFSLNMKDPSAWTASCSFRSFVDIETALFTGPTLALMDLHRIVKSMIKTEQSQLKEENV